MPLEEVPSLAKARGRMAHRRSGLFIWIAIIASASALADTEKLVVMANGERVGQLTAEVTGHHVSIDYAVVNNGRGPKIREQINFDAAGTVSRWVIEGESTFGSPVSESYSREGGTAKWKSQADEGTRPSATRMLYVGNDASPWMRSVYVRQLLKAPDRTLPVLPSGQLRVSEGRKVTLGEGRAATPLTLYELSGLTLEPEYILTDRRGALFGFGDGSLIREGYEGFHQELKELGRDARIRAAEEAQRKLAHRFIQPVRIRNVRIFDPISATVGALSEVVVYANRIATVRIDNAEPAREGEVVLDGEGGTLVPGLYDMHSHTSLASNLFNLAAGVTSTRDQGNDNEQLLAIVRSVDSGSLAGPRIVRNGLIEGRSAYSARIGLIAETLEGGIAHVRWYAEHGYQQIKLYNSVPPDWVSPLAAEAHKLGLGVTGHVPAFSSPDRVIREGYDDIAHINQLMLGWILKPQEDTRTLLRLTGMLRAKDLDLSSERVRTTIAAMRSNHVALDTTACALEQLMLSRAGAIQPGDAAHLDHMPIGYQRYRKRSFVTITSEADDVAWRMAFQKLLDVIRTLDAEGVQLLPGTDDMNGFAQLRELELYVAAGLPAGRVLYLGTLGAARYLRRDDQLGTIQRGKLADFFLVDGDPTQDIRVLRRNRMTVRDGVIYYPSDIYEHLAVKPFVPPPPIIAHDKTDGLSGGSAPE